MTNGEHYRTSSNTTPPPTSDDPQLAAELSGLGDNASISDTDGSRADGSAAEDGKGQEQFNTVKRTASFKPVSFAKAKFAVAKGVGASTGVKTAADKGDMTSLFNSRP